MTGLAIHPPPRRSSSDRAALSRRRPGASSLPAGPAPELLLDVLGVVPLGAASGCCAASSATTCARRASRATLFCENRKFLLILRRVDMTHNIKATTLAPISVEELAAEMEISPNNLRLAIELAAAAGYTVDRSEERRVGKEC